MAPAAPFYSKRMSGLGSAGSAGGLLVFLLLPAMMQVGRVAAQTAYPGYTTQSGVGYLGHDITPTDPAAPINVAQCGQLEATQESITNCLARCNTTPGCLGASYKPANQCCYLKSSLENAITDPPFMSYVKSGS